MIKQADYAAHDALVGQSTELSEMVREIIRDEKKQTGGFWRIDRVIKEIRARTGPDVDAYDVLVKATTGLPEGSGWIHPRSELAEFQSLKANLQSANKRH